ncbi:MAG TPA: MarR family transcriptional regulator [Chloroflexota bacterium]
MSDREHLTQRVLEQHDRLFRCVLLRQTDDWLSVEFTMQQLKALVLLDTMGSATSGQLARGLGVGLSTMTRIVDRLAESAVVTRGEDPDDRRATRVQTTPAGHDFVARLRQLRHEHMARLLERLSVAELEQAAAVSRFLAEAAEAVAMEGTVAGEAPP